MFSTQHIESWGHPSIIALAVLSGDCTPTIWLRYWTRNFLVIPDFGNLTLAPRQLSAWCLLPLGCYWLSGVGPLISSLRTKMEHKWMAEFWLTSISAVRAILNQAAGLNKTDSSFQLVSTEVVLPFSTSMKWHAVIGALPAPLGILQSNSHQTKRSMHLQKKGHGILSNKLEKANFVLQLENHYCGGNSGP